MRTWRVGSISMGLLLLLLGILLILAHFFNIETTTILVTWWPIILVVLGIEILLFLYFSKQEKPYMSYDFLSIIFVGLLGMLTLGLTTLTTTGLLDKVNDWTHMSTQSLNLPSYEISTEEEIERIVVQTNNHSLNVQETHSDSFHLFGSYEAQIIKDEPPIQSLDDYLLINKIDDTLYIQIKKQYNRLSIPFDDQLHFDTTIIVPSEVSLEVKGDNNLVTLSPRELLNTWTVHQVAHADIIIDEETDVFIQADHVYDLQGDIWDRNQTEEEHIHSGSIKFGSGKHQLSINQAQVVSVIKR